MLYIHVLLSHASSFQSGAQVSALVRRYAGDDAKLPARRAAPAGGKRPRGGSAAPGAGAAAGATATLRPNVVQAQPQRTMEAQKPQAQPLQAVTAGSDRSAAPERPPLGSSGKQPLQAGSSMQNNDSGGGGSSSNHKTADVTAKKGGDTSSASGGGGNIGNVNAGGNINRTGGAGSSKPPPPVSGAEARARAAGIEAFKAFQQRQQELRRRRRAAAGDRQCCIRSLNARCPIDLHCHGCAVYSCHCGETTCMHLSHVAITSCAGRLSNPGLGSHLDPLIPPPTP